MPVYITYFIQLLLVIHVLKTGRNRSWIWLLIMLPMIGGVAYLVIEILPGLGGSLTGQRTMRKVRKAVNPGAELRQHAAAWEQSPNADNARRYAQALIESEQFTAADEVLDEALRGFFATEPNLLLLKARSNFAAGDADKAVSVLERLTEENPDFRSAHGHLLHARALESCGRLDEAVSQYRAVSTYFPGAEARYRLAAALQANGEEQQSRQEFEQIINDAKLAPAHFRKSQKEWLNKARSELQKFP